MHINIKVGRKVIGHDQPCFIIAEAGINHNGDIDLAYKLIDAAVQAGADAVKFQTYKTENLVTLNAPKANYQLDTSNTTETQYEMLKKLELSYTDHIKLFEYCKRKNIIFLSSPFDEQSADFLEKLGVKLFKIPSPELTNILLLKHISIKNLPIILSTGMSTMDEIKLAVNTITKFDKSNLILLHCISNYPTKPDEVNLRAIETLKKTFKLVTGFSDHTLGIEISLAAVTLGASVIEKHITLDKKLSGPDHKVSLDIKEFKDLVNAIRNVEAAMGDNKKYPSQSEIAISKIVRKSLVAASDLPKGAILTIEMLKIKRPGTGLPPCMLNNIIGKELKVAIKADTIIKEEMLN